MAIYYVSTSGDNTTGLSWTTAFHTITQAAAVVAAGDEVQIAAATYPEYVSIVSSGTLENPIVWRGIGGQAVIDGESYSHGTFSITLSHNHFYNFTAKSTISSSHGFWIHGNSADNNKFFDCVADDCSAGGFGFLVETDADGNEFKRCVAKNGLGGFWVRDSAISNSFFACLAYGNTGQFGFGFTSGGVASFLFCTSTLNNGGFFLWGTGVGGVCKGCICYDNSIRGINVMTDVHEVDYNCSYGNLFDWVYSNTPYDLTGWQANTPYGDHSIEADPLLVTGSGGDYYLSQIISGQGSDSPCVDSAYDQAATLGLDEYTTRTDEEIDENVADIGFHYYVGAPPLIAAVGSSMAGKLMAAGLL